MSADGKERKRFSIKAMARPTSERVRHARSYGGLVDLSASAAEPGCFGVRYPLLIDFLRDRGRLTPQDHQIALRVRELYDQTSFRAHITSSYQERAGRSAENPVRDEIDDRYRRLDGRVLRRAGRDAWTAMRAIVIEDRMSASCARLPHALAEAERWL